ncbi:MAG: alpha/beta fold hydrolase [Alphaproteobacteria bacterium]|nr:alpha/beta fold hydrolase [Alphaproteobacteria bacterium]
MREPSGERSQMGGRHRKPYLQLNATQAVSADLNRCPPIRLAASNGSRRSTFPRKGGRQGADLMPAVFVHGVPDTPAMWKPLLSKLKRRDVITLALPGFGNKRPPGFEATKESYVAWLIDQMSKIAGPIDLVGHDWGSLLVTRAVSLKPELVRTWCGGAAPLHPDYVWHDTAKIWQTPGQGEEFMKVFGGEPVAQALMGQGQPKEVAEEAASHIDEDMKACILTLYRSAVNASAEWYPDLKNAPKRALILWGENDAFAAPKFGELLARDTGGTFQLMKGCGHWYPAQDPAAMAEALERHWSAR